ncbi:MAG: polyprenyl synthetase family protein [Deltaproteobacteria bacterium]|nr:polyprenyl synthetase family protein [Deltaproteobacteria bacterium]
MGYRDRFAKYQERVESALAASLARCEGPARLLEAMEYSLMAGGKRLRPVLLLVTRDLFEKDGPDPLPAACALEFIHTYSLIHDDLPALDDDDLRRNRPSCHRRFDEATAILAGDALLTQAFWLLSEAYGSLPDDLGLRVVGEVARATGTAGMVGGQALDTLETGRLLERAELERMHRMKTGALIAAPVRCGALLGGADEIEIDRLTGCARRMGLAFQVVDDILDVVGERDKLGKTIGKDQAQGKTTYVTLLGVEGSRDLARDLHKEVLEGLAPFGPAADRLRELAAFIVDRAF